jgi:uncharacterized protein (TIGR03437 family)
MLNRYVSLAACLSLFASISAFGQGNQGAGYVFELPGPSSAGSNLQGFIYNGNFVGPDIPTGVGPAGGHQIVAKPDGSKFYVLGTTSGGLESTVDFAHFTAINGVSGIPCVAAITPDGKYLLVGTTGTAAGATCGSGSNSNTLYVLDTNNNDAPLSISSLPQISGGIVGFAVSQDSTTAWMLTGSPSAASLTEFSLSASPAEKAFSNMPCCDLSGITLAPSGLLYVTGGGGIYEVTPSAANILGCSGSIANQSPPLCVTPNGVLSVRATPGPLHFTPSGKVAYAINTNPSGYPTSLLALTIGTGGNSVATWPPTNYVATPPAFADVFVTSESEIFAISTTDPNYPTTLWDVTPASQSAPMTAAIDTTFSNITPASSVASVAVSNELPAAQYLYALVTNNVIYRINLATLSFVQTPAQLGQGLLDFVSVPDGAGSAAEFGTFVPPLNGAVGFIQYTNGSAWTIPAGTSTTLAALVLDSLGRPVFNQPVSFAEASTDTITGVVISPPPAAAQVTNANGFVTATVTVPTKPGTYNVVLTAGSASVTFALTVPGAGGGPTGPTGGPSQVTIVSGNGEFIRTGFSVFNEPLTVLVTDTTGKPMPNVQVTFSVGVGQVTGYTIGQLDNPVTATDVNGLASTDFTSPQLPEGVQIAFDSTTVTASTTSLGSVTFTETVYQINQDGTGAPQIALVAPTSGVITAGEGDVLPNAIITSITTNFGGQSQYVPNVGIRLANGADPTMPSPASCQGSSLSDTTGLAHCNVAVSCQVALGLAYPISVVTGENSATTISLHVTTGSSQTLTMKSGNSQIGNAGSTLASPLVASVTDNCGTPKSGVPVTWSVSNGSTLTNTVSTSSSVGIVSTNVILGQTPGTVQVTATLGTTQVVFTVTDQVAVAGISLVSGGGQAVNINQTFPQPLIFSVTDVNQKPVSGIIVTFSVPVGSAAVNPASATTNAQGQVSTMVLAGSTPGAITILAAFGKFGASASLTANLPGPSVTANSFTNAATANSLNPQVGLVPCGLSTVTGNGLAATIQGVLPGSQLGFGGLPYTLGGLTMSINGVPAPLYSISNINGVQQVNFQTPCETTPGTAIAIITVNGGTPSVVPGIQVLAAQPGIFNQAGPSGQPYGFVVRVLDGSLVSPSNPAHPGESYYLYVTGMGQTIPPITTNSAGTGTEIIPVSQVSVGVNNAGVPVTLVEYEQGQIGVYFVFFTIPANATTGTNQPLAVEVNGVFGNPVYLPAIE